MFVEARERYEKRHNLIVSPPEGDVVRPPRKFEKIVVKAAEWIDDNPPPHVTDSNGLQYGMRMGAQRFCSFGSSFVHGYKWMRDYVARAGADAVGQRPEHRFERDLGAVVDGQQHTQRQQ